MRTVSTYMHSFHFEIHFGSYILPILFISNPQLGRMERRLELGAPGACPNLPHFKVKSLVSRREDKGVVRAVKGDFNKHWQTAEIPLPTSGWPNFA